MTEEELNKLIFRERSHTTYDDEYHTIYECVSEPFAGRLSVNIIQKRDKQTGFTVGKERVHYSLDGRVYFTKARFLEAITNNNGRYGNKKCKVDA